GRVPMPLVTVLIFLGFCTVLGCKRTTAVSTAKETEAIASAYRGVFHFSGDMIVPYPNTGYDRAFCAGTSLLHAIVFNRVRFHEANPPSLKCPSRFNLNDDKAYEDAVWAAIKA